MNASSRNERGMVFQIASVVICVACCGCAGPAERLRRLGADARYYSGMDVMHYGCSTYTTNCSTYTASFGAGGSVVDAENYISWSADVQAPVLEVRLLGEDRREMMAILAELADYDARSKGVSVVMIAEEEIPDEVFETITRIDNVKLLRFERVRITPERIRSLVRLEDLPVLILISCSIAERDMPLLRWALPHTRIVAHP